MMKEQCNKTNQVRCAKCAKCGKAIPEEQAPEMDESGNYYCWDCAIKEMKGESK